MGTVRTSRPWMGYPPQVVPAPGEQVLVEFDWEPLRRWGEQQEAPDADVARAELSLAKLNAKLRARNLRRHLLPLVGAALAPVALFLLVRYAVHLHAARA